MGIEPEIYSEIYSEIYCVEVGIYEIQGIEKFSNGIKITSLELTEKAKDAFGLRRDLKNEQETIKEALEG